MNFWNSQTTLLASAETWHVSAGPTTAQDPPLYFPRRKPMVLSSPFAPVEMRNSHLFLYSVCHDTSRGNRFITNQHTVQTQQWVFLKKSVWNEIFLRIYVNLPVPEMVGWLLEDNTFCCICLSVQIAMATWLCWCCQFLWQNRIFSQLTGD